MEVRLIIGDLFIDPGPDLLDRRADRSALAVMAGDDRASVSRFAGNLCAAHSGYTQTVLLVTQLYRLVRYNYFMRNKIAISFRLSPEAIDLIKELARSLGVSQADIIELAVRRLQKQEQAIDSHTERHTSD